MDQDSHAYNVDVATTPRRNSTTFGTRWSGVYIGGHLGAGFGNWSLAESNIQSYPYDACSGCTPAYVAGTQTFNSSNVQQLHPLGFITGAQAGYLWSLGNISFGPEIELSLANIKQVKDILNQSNTTCSPNPIPTWCTTSGQWIGSVSAYIDWLSTIRGRIGINYGD